MLLSTLIGPLVLMCSLPTSATTVLHQDVLEGAVAATATAMTGTTKTTTSIIDVVGNGTYLFGFTPRAVLDSSTSYAGTAVSITSAQSSGIRTLTTSPGYGCNNRATSFEDDDRDLFFSANNNDDRTTFDDNHGYLPSEVDVRYDTIDVNMKSTINNQGSYNMIGSVKDDDKTTNSNSPPVSDCEAFSGYLATHLGDWHLQKLAANTVQRLGSVGTCRLGVTVAEPLANGVDVWIGPQDAIEIIQTAIATLADDTKDKVGGAGAMLCEGTMKGEVNWVLDTWVIM
ncbi:hypothetical protein BX600DRAFT_436247 [Xylariales sp. PMI_506]|nr:hypothetical protein BX600DRAFT_436247 [Xylariales sp. PMI_506]